jgi:hypothetical protein
LVASTHRHPVGHAGEPKEEGLEVRPVIATVVERDEWPVLAGQIAERLEQAGYRPPKRAERFSRPAAVIKNTAYVVKLRTTGPQKDGRRIFDKMRPKYWHLR